MDDEEELLEIIEKSNDPYSTAIYLLDLILKIAQQ